MQLHNVYFWLRGDQDEQAQLSFEHLAGHDRYQAGAAHFQFLDDHLSKWERVVVHDIETA